MTDPVTKLFEAGWKVKVWRNELGSYTAQAWRPRVRPFKERQKLYAQGRTYIEALFALAEVTCGKTYTGR